MEGDGILGVIYIAYMDLTISIYHLNKLSDAQSRCQTMEGIRLERISLDENSVPQ